MPGRKDANAEEWAALRQRAEKMLKNVIAKTAPSLAPQHAEALVHELQVHQIELEAQNEDLRRSREEAEEARDQYYDLYETSPAPYITLDQDLHIERVNAAAERLLGVTRTGLIGRRLSEYVDTDDVLAFTKCWRAVLQGPDPVTCEVKLRYKDRTKAVLMEMCLVGSSPNNQRVRLTATDITERKRTEEHLKTQERALRESQHQLQSLSGRLLSMEQDIRQGIAHDLEEEYQQRMAVILWELSALERSERLTARGLDKLHGIQRLISHMGRDCTIWRIAYIPAFYNTTVCKSRCRSTSKTSTPL
jgi:PAS domain S-box-containing protein